MKELISLRLLVSSLLLYKKRTMGCKSTKERTSNDITTQFDADWLPFLDGKTVNDYKRLVKANAPFQSHDEGQAWANEILKRMHSGLERRGLKGTYKYDQVGQQAEGQINIQCTMTMPYGDVTRTLSYQLQYNVIGFNNGGPVARQY